jgi:hypothetical protein
MLAPDHGEAAMEFTHPLARAAKVWPMRSRDGHDQKVLVIVTTLTLDAESESHKPKLVERLSAAAQNFLATSKEATGFVLINRLRDWKPRGETRR